MAHNRRIGPAPADDRLDPASLAVLELSEHLSAIGADELRQIRLLDDELTGTEESVEVVATGKSWRLPTLGNGALARRGHGGLNHMIGDHSVSPPAPIAAPASSESLQDL